MPHTHIPSDLKHTKNLNAAKSNAQIQFNCNVRCYFSGQIRTLQLNETRKTKKYINSVQRPMS